MMVSGIQTKPTTKRTTVGAKKGGSEKRRIRTYQFVAGRVKAKWSRRRRSD